MKKQLILLSLAALLSTTTLMEAAGVALFAHMGRFREEMNVGDEQKVNAETMRITAGHDIVMITEKESGKWVITALKAGTAEICLEKSKPGYKSRRHKCCHPIVVTNKKGITAEVKRAAKRVAAEVEDVVEDIEQDVTMLRQKAKGMKQDVKSGVDTYKQKRAERKATKPARNAQ